MYIRRLAFTLCCHTYLTSEADVTFQVVHTNTFIWNEKKSEIQKIGAKKTTSFFEILSYSYLFFWFFPPPLTCWVYFELFSHIFMQMLQHFCTVDVPTPYDEIYMKLLLSWRLLILCEKKRRKWKQNRKKENRSKILQTNIFLCFIAVY